MTFQALTIPSAIKPRTPACSTVKNPCSSVSVNSAMRKNRKSLTYQNSRSSFQYARTANHTMTTKITYDMLASLDDVRAAFQWFKNCAFGVPAAFESVMDKASVNINKFCPLGHGFGHIANDQKSVHARVAHLLFVSRPAAILRLVIAVILDPVKSMFRSWWFANISGKCLEIIPSLANRDTATTVVVKSLLTRQKTSVVHFAPNPVKSCLGSSVSRSGSADHCGSTASAGLRVPGSDVLAQNKSFVSARASAVPFNMPLSHRGRAANNVKLIESLPGDVDKFSTHSDKLSHRMMEINSMAGG